MISVAIVVVLVNVIGLVIVLATLSRVNVPANKTMNWPKVSIIISVRNERENVQRFIEGLSSLSYPSEKLEVLIGDDHSADDTWEVLKRLKNNSISLYQASTEMSGKVKMLDFLSKKAKGECLLYIDADIRVSSDWVKSMVTQLQNGQMSAGMTTVAGNRWFDYFQNIDWLTHQKLIAWFTRFFKPMTIWGNNMAIRKDALKEVNYYEGVLDSIVEDVAMMKKIECVGVISINTSSASVVETLPSYTFKELVSQRKRWLRGFNLVPSYTLLFAMVKYIYLPCLLLLGVYDSVWWFLFLPIKSIVLVLLIREYEQDLDNWKKYLSYLLFDGYEFVIYFSTFVASTLNKSVVWKDRQYRN